MTDAAPAPHAHKRPRTGAGARFNGDHIGLYRAVNYGILVTAVAAVLVSWQGLSAAAHWLLLPSFFTWLLPVMIDVPIVVFTLGILNRKARGEGIFLLAFGAYGLTLISAATNFFHVVVETPTTTGGTTDIAVLTPNLLAEHFQNLPITAWFGASLAGLAPLLVLLTTEVLGLMMTKPPRSERATARQNAKNARRDLTALNKQLKAANKEIERLKAAPTPPTEGREPGLTVEDLRSVLGELWKPTVVSPAPAARPTSSSPPTSFPYQSAPTYDPEGVNA